MNPQTKFGFWLFILIFLSACMEDNQNYVDWSIEGGLYNGTYRISASPDEVPGKAIGLYLPAYDSTEAKSIVTFEDKDQNWIASLNIPADSTEFIIEKGSKYNFSLTDTKQGKSLQARGLKITILQDSTADQKVLKETASLDLHLRFEGEMEIRDSNNAQMIHKVKGELKFFQPVIAKE